MSARQEIEIACGTSWHSDTKSNQEQTKAVQSRLRLGISICGLCLAASLPLVQVLVITKPLQRLHFMTPRGSTAQLVHKSSFARDTLSSLPVLASNSNSNAQVKAAEAASALDNQIEHSPALGLEVGLQTFFSLRPWPEPTSGLD